MIFLVEAEALDEATGRTVTLRFAGPSPYITRPDDDPPFAEFRSRLNDPGNFERHLFGQGRTFGESSVGAGEVRLNNADGKLDFVLDLIFAGRPLRIFTIQRVTDRWSERRTVLIGTAEQATANGREISILLRDALDLLREPVQTAVYLGTTTAPGMNVAEGTAELKDLKRPWLAGRALSIPPVLVDQFDHVYDVTAGPLHGIENVRDQGVPRTPTRDYPTLPAMKAASLAFGQYATCLAAGKLRLHDRPDGTLTLDAFEGATLADRSAARVARRLIGAIGTVREADFEALHALDGAETGLWLPPGETTRLSAATLILSSVTGFLTADMTGAYRTGRLLLPEGPPAATLTSNTLIDRGEGFQRLRTNDPGDGVPAWRITVRFARRHTTFSEVDLKDVATDDAFRTSSEREYQEVVAEDEAIRKLHPKAIPMTFTVALLDEGAARLLANRLLAFYRRPRPLFRVAQVSRAVAGVELNDCVTLQIARFGLDAGRLMRVLGVTPTLKNSITTLELLG